MSTRLPVEAGRLASGMAYLALGEGAPLVVLAGLTPTHDVPRGTERSMQVDQLRPLATGRRVLWVNRRPGLETGTDVADLAADYAAVLRERFPVPVDVVGSSTGGVVALALAADHPDVVRRLVLWASACRLGEEGRATQRRVASLTRSGRHRRAMAVMGAALVARRWTRPVMAAAGMAMGGAHGPGAADMLVTIDAEDAADLEARLPGIRVPVLVVGGDRDRFYGGELFRRTADLLPDGRAVLLPGVGHMRAFSDPRAAGAIRAFLDADDDAASR